MSQQHQQQKQNAQPQHSAQAKAVEQVVEAIKPLEQQVAVEQPKAEPDDAIRLKAELEQMKAKYEKELAEQKELAKLELEESNKVQEHKLQQAEEARQAEEFKAKQSEEARYKAEAEKKEEQDKRLLAESKGGVKNRIQTVIPNVLIPAAIMGVDNIPAEGTQRYIEFKNGQYMTRLSFSQRKDGKYAARINSCWLTDTEEWAFMKGGSAFDMAQVDDLIKGLQLIKNQVSVLERKV